MLFSDEAVRRSQESWLVRLKNKLACRLPYCLLQVVIVYRVRCPSTDSPTSWIWRSWIQTMLKRPCLNTVSSVWQIAVVCSPSLDSRDGVVHGWLMLPTNNNVTHAWLKPNGPFSEAPEKWSVARFSKVPETFRARKAVAKSRTLWLQNYFIYIF